MSIQYATGTIVFENAWTQSSGTKTELCSRIYENFITAGWTSVSVTGGSGARTAFIVRCVATTTSNLQCEVRCDIASTNCVRLYMQEVGGLNPQTGGLFLLPAVGKIWMMVINRHQFFIWVKGGQAQRGFAAGGVLYIPSFLNGVLTTSIWGQGIAYNDADTTLNATIRNLLYQCTSGANTYQNANSAWWEMNNNSGGNSYAAQRFIITTGAYVNSSVWCFRWHDGSVWASDPLLAWGTTNTTESLIRGQVWDAVLSSDAVNPDATITYDSRTYIAITAWNGGSLGVAVPGTLWIATT